MNNELDALLQRLPGDSREMAHSCWRVLPADIRREFELTLGAFVKVLREDSGAATDLVHLLKRQAGPAVKPFSRVAVVGPVNVGKSTLFNAIVSGVTEEAETSPVPGTTRENREADLGLFRLVDTPGADHGANVGSKEKETAMEAAMASDFILIVFDASRSVLASDRVLYGELRGMDKPHLVVLNKIDLVPCRHREKVIAAAADVLYMSPGEIHPTSATKETGIENLLLEVTAAEPRLLGEMGRVLPPLRRKLGWQSVRRSAVGACLVSLTPIPIVDLVPLTAIQATMVLTLARVYDQEVSIARVGELLASFGAGLLARTLFQQASKLAGWPGWALSASIAGATTVAIGYSAMRWFETGHKPTTADLVRVAGEVQRKLLENLNPFGRRKPSKKRLKGGLEERMAAVTGELEEGDGPPEE